MALLTRRNLYPDLCPKYNPLLQRAARRTTECPPGRALQRRDVCFHSTMLDEKVPPPPLGENNPLFRTTQGDISTRGEGSRARSLYATPPSPPPPPEF